MITLEILDYENNIVETWTWELSKPIPEKGDTLLIHFGENNESIYRVSVLRKEFDITRPNVISIVTNYVKLTKDTEEY